MEAGDKPGGPRAALARFLGSRGIRSRVLAPFSFDALIIATNLITGVIVARALGPAGRGEIAAILVIVLTATWLFSLGSTEAVAFRQSRAPEDAPQLIGLWLAVAFFMGALAIAVAELVLPTLFSAQSDAAITMARFYVPVIVVSLVITVFNGVLLGDQDFFAYNVLRLLTPAVVAIGYVGCLLAGEFSVETALIANAAGFLVACLGATVRSLRKHGIARPERSLARSSLWYGMRAHGGSIAGFVNARLDLLILPAFLAAASVGQYSVATNVTSLIGTLTGTIAIFAMPVAARLESASARIVIRTLHATFAIGVVIAIFLAIVAGIAVPLVYGSEFDSAVTPMRIMLPGEVLDAASVVLWAGLLAANRPFLSSVAAGPGAILTIGGLILFLESGGIVAAAIVTLSAHTVVFVISALLYRHALGLRWREFLPPGPAARGEDTAR
jgi:O-antigen/teichoic acid export membrane protein